MPRVLGESQGGERFLMGEVPIYVLAFLRSCTVHMRVLNCVCTYVPTYLRAHTLTLIHTCIRTYVLARVRACVRARCEYLGAKGTYGCKITRGTE